MIRAETSPLVVDEVPFMAERCVDGTCTGFMMMIEGEGRGSDLEVSCFGEGKGKGMGKGKGKRLMDQ